MNNDFVWDHGINDWVPRAQGKNMSEILKSTTCACYRDDDGLHPCDRARILVSPLDFNDHVVRAFNLKIAPEKPKRAAKLENGWWRAPCGCEVHTETHGLGTTCADYYGPNHLIKAVAAVMREQVPPMPTDEEIDAWFKSWTHSQRRDPEGQISWSVRGAVVAAVKWALAERRGRAKP